MILCAFRSEIWLFTQSCEFLLASNKDDYVGCIGCLFNYFIGVSYWLICVNH